MSLPFGFHTGSGGLGVPNRFFESAKSHGIPIFAKATDTSQSLYDALRIADGDPSAVVIFRRSVRPADRTAPPSGDPNVPRWDVHPWTAAQEHWEWHKKYIPQDLLDNYPRDLITVEITNEIAKEFVYTRREDIPESYLANRPAPYQRESDGRWVLSNASWVGWFLYHAALYVIDDGFRFAGPGWTTGEPEPEHWSSPGMIDFMRLACDYPDKIYVAIHEYRLSINATEFVDYYHIGRVKMMADACHQAGIGIPSFVITEWGWTYTGVPDMPRLRTDLIAALNEYSKYESFRGLAVWALNAGYSDIHTKLSGAINELEVIHDMTFPDPIYPQDPDVDPPPADANEGNSPMDYNKTYHVVSSWNTPSEIDQIYAIARERMQSVGPSAHDAGIGNGPTGAPLKSKTVVFYNMPSDVVQDYIDFYDEYFPSVSIVLESLNGSIVTPPRWQAFPTIERTVTQWFGANPQNYSQFGLPGHEGLDMRAIHGSPIYAVTDGLVVGLNATDTGNYGIHVVIEDGDGWLTTYAHMERLSVSVGQRVIAGQQIGNADDTGNSYGSHLHITVKKPDTTYIDPAGQSWPNGIHDPWLGASALYNPTTTCWIWNDYLVVNQDASWAFLTQQANARASASQGGALLGVVGRGQPVIIAGPPSNGYRPVKATVSGAPPPSGPAAAPGIHFGSDNWLVGEADFDEIAKLPTRKVIKFLSTAEPADVDRVVRENPGATYIVRAFLSFGGRDISPAQFCNDTLSDVFRTRDHIIENGGDEPLIELHNEPNLYSEGAGASWVDGADFGRWLSSVADTYIANGLTELMIPGMSPGGGIAGVRLEYIRFIQSMNTTLTASFAAVGAHAYWAHDFPISEAVNQVLVVYHNRKDAVPVYVTEASNNKEAPPLQKAAEYVDFCNRLGGIAAGVAFFILSSAGFQNEVWIKDGSSQGIAAEIARLI